MHLFILFYFHNIRRKTKQNKNKKEIFNFVLLVFIFMLIYKNIFFSYQALYASIIYIFAVVHSKMKIKRERERERERENREW